MTVMASHVGFNKLPNLGKFSNFETEHPGTQLNRGQITLGTLYHGAEKEEEEGGPSGLEEEEDEERFLAHEEEELSPLKQDDIYSSQVGQCLVPLPVQPLRIYQQTELPCTVPNPDACNPQIHDSDPVSVLESGPDTLPELTDLNDIIEEDDDQNILDFDSNGFNSPKGSTAEKGEESERLFLTELDFEPPQTVVQTNPPEHLFSNNPFGEGPESLPGPSKDAAIYYVPESFATPAPNSNCDIKARETKPVRVDVARLKLTVDDLKQLIDDANDCGRYYSDDLSEHCLIKCWICNGEMNIQAMR